jgi:Flp pilus assembly protein CpaB
MTYRVRNIGIAVALAALAAILTIFYVRNYTSNAEQAQETITVYTATKDAAAGTLGSDLVGALQAEKVVRETSAPGAITAPGQVEKLVVGEAIYAGEQVTMRHFTTVEEQGVRLEITGTERAYQLPGDANQLLAGTLKPGDRVDVVASIDYKILNLRPTNGRSSAGGGEDAASDSVAQNETFVASRVVLRDLRVLEVAEDTGDSSAIRESANPNLSVVLAVTDAQIQKLFFVQMNSDWALQLRPSDDPADSRESVETVGTVLVDGLKASQLRLLAGGTYVR